MVTAMDVPIREQASLQDRRISTNEALEKLADPETSTRMRKSLLTELKGAASDPDLQDLIIGKYKSVAKDETTKRVLTTSIERGLVDSKVKAELVDQMLRKIAAPGGSE